MAFSFGSIVGAFFAGVGGSLFGLDDYSISSFGLRYGVTDRLSVSAYRSPSFSSAMTPS